MNIHPVTYLQHNKGTLAYLPPLRLAWQHLGWSGDLSEGRHLVTLPAPLVLMLTMWWWWKEIVKPVWWGWIWHCITGLWCDLSIITWNADRIKGTNGNWLVWFMTYTSRHQTRRMMTSLSMWPRLLSRVKKPRAGPGSSCDSKNDVMLLVQLALVQQQLQMDDSFIHSQAGIYLWTHIYAAIGLPLWLAKVYIWSMGNLCYIMWLTTKVSICNWVTF